MAFKNAAKILSSPPIRFVLVTGVFVLLWGPVVMTVVNGAGRYAEARSTAADTSRAAQDAVQHSMPTSATALR